MTKDETVSLEEMTRRVGEALAGSMNTARWSITGNAATIMITDRWADNSFVFTIKKID